jgi:hypothetical protein
MRAGRSGGDDEYLGDDEKVSHFEKHDVEALLVGDGIGGQPGGCNCVYGVTSSVNLTHESLGHGEDNPGSYLW